MLVMARVTTLGADPDDDVAAAAVAVDDDDDDTTEDADDAEPGLARILAVVEFIAGVGIIDAEPDDLVAENMIIFDATGMRVSESALLSVLALATL